MVEKIQEEDFVLQGGGMICDLNFNIQKWNLWCTSHSLRLSRQQQSKDSGSNYVTHGLTYVLSGLHGSFTCL